MKLNDVGMGLAVVLVIALIILSPFAVIWAWNTLFGGVHYVDYTFWTWLAVIVMGAFMSPNATAKR